MAPSLISTDVFPGDSMSPEAIGSAASMMRFVGAQVATDSADVVKAWSAISGSYVAPESGSLVAAMDPVQTSGATFGAHLGSAADALVTFADAVRTIKKTLEGLRERANLLLGTIDSNGKVGAGGIGPGSDWYHDPVAFGQNEELLAAVEAQAALLKTAERTCAGAIEGLAGGGQRGENGGPGFGGVTAPTVADQPWGHVMTGKEMSELWEKEAPGWERGAAKKALEGVQGAAALAGFDTSQFDPSSGLPHGTLFGSWSGRNIATTLEGISHLLYDPKAWLAVGKDLIAYGDWDNPSFALGEVGFNVLSLAFAFTKVGSVTKISTAGREAIDAAGPGKLAADAAEASRLARLAEIGQRVGSKVTVPTLDGLKALARTAKLDTAWSKVFTKVDTHITVPDHDITIDRAPARPHGDEPLHGDRPAGDDASDAADQPVHHDPPGPTDHPDHGSGASDGAASDADPGLAEVGSRDPHDLGGLGTKESPKQYWFTSPAEALRTAKQPSSIDLEDLDQAGKYDPGTPEHMAARWSAYLSNPNTAGLSWEAWRNGYIAKQGNHYKGVAFEDVVVHDKGLTAADGWTRHARVKLPAERDYDIYSETRADAWEIKANGSVVKAQVVKDAAAVAQGIRVHYVFGAEPTPMSVRLLTEAHITWEVVHSVAVPVG